MGELIPDRLPEARCAHSPSPLAHHDSLEILHSGGRCRFFSSFIYFFIYLFAQSAVGTTALKAELEPAGGRCVATWNGCQRFQNWPLSRVLSAFHSLRKFTGCDFETRSAGRKGEFLLLHSGGFLRRRTGRAVLDAFTWYFTRMKMFPKVSPRAWMAVWSSQGSSSLLLLLKKSRKLLLHSPR